MKRDNYNILEKSYTHPCDTKFFNTKAQRRMWRLEFGCQKTEFSQGGIEVDYRFMNREIVRR